MRRFSLTFLSFFFICALHAQSPSNDIVIGKIDSLSSPTLKETRAIWVYVPDRGNGLYAPRHYPVVYLLDGDAHFYSVVGMIQQLSQVNGNTICPEMIVVGIPNTDRTRDLTPTHVSASPYLDSSFVKTSGGGERFTEFIEKELIPYVDSHYPTAPYRMLIGHSFGGLLVVNTLFHHPALFNSYLAVDPSLWWDNQKLLKEAMVDLTTKRFEGKTLFLAMANTMSASMDTSRVRSDTAQSTMHIRSILQFADALKRGPAGGLNWSWKYYNDDNHGSVPLIAEYDALRFFFSYYRLPAIANVTDPSFNVDSVLSAHFSEVSRHMGYAVLPPEALVNQIGYTFLQQKMLSRARTFFEMNVRNYPSSFNVYDSMGDCYAAEGKNDEAIGSYAKALSLREYPETRKKMEELKSRK
jgi:predicted alpha/beta superfamily hydrolase